MTHSTVLLKILQENDIKQEQANLIIDIVTDIGFDYICNSTDALNYCKRIKVLKHEINNYYEPRRL